MIRAPLLSNIPTVQSSSVSGRNQSDNQHQPFSYNILLTSFSCGKIIISIITLRTDSGSHQELRTWLALATICDMINAILLICDTKKLLSHFFSNRQNSSNSNREHWLDEESQQTPAGERWPPPNQAKWSRTLLILNNCFYFALWIGGHYLYYKSCVDCFESVQAIANLVFLYLYCGYFYVAASLLMAIFDHSCLSFFTFSHSSLASKSRVAWKAPIPKLSVKTYSSTMNESSECYICLLNYNEGDELAELPCNINHHFHEGCIKKWLKINNACPLCRKTVGGLSQAPTMNEVELPVLMI